MNKGRRYRVLGGALFLLVGGALTYVLPNVAKQWTLNMFLQSVARRNNEGRTSYRVAIEYEYHTHD